MFSFPEIAVEQIAEGDIIVALGDDTLHVDLLEVLEAMEVGFGMRPIRHRVQRLVLALAAGAVDRVRVEQTHC
jgi:hypothetical protein